MKVEEALEGVIVVTAITPRTPRNPSCTPTRHNPLRPSAGQQLVSLFIARCVYSVNRQELLSFRSRAR